MTTIRTYLRVSSQSQADSGLGVEAQRNAITNYISANYAGCDVVEYCDLGVSGSVGINKRDGLCALVDALNDGDVVVAYDHSRIARDIIVSIDVETTISRKGGDLIFTTGANCDSA